MKGNKPYVVVFIIQAIYAAMFLLSKAAFDHGMNNFIFVFYRQAIATLFLLPFAFFFEWKTAPPLSFLTFCKIFFLSFFGITLSLDIYGIGLIYTTATLAAAATNSLPVITFVLALLLRIEYLKITSSAGIAKLVGLLACVVGVTTLALYKGPRLEFLSHHHILSYHETKQLHGHESSATWIKGCFLLLLSNSFFGLWLVLQSFVIKVFPSKLLFTTLQCFLSSIQCFVIAIAVERDIEQWKLAWNVRLISVLYCGIMVTGVTYYLQTWVIEKKGPVFFAMSTPLSLILTILSSALVLGVIIRLGSILGGIALIIGLYCVLWGKSREQMPKVPLNLEHASG
ncbi:PREDICTED: WAT1-related protein At5g64700-like isoform X1 [Lupinus angustifolius]|uniref:WAT1-related protein At5g64700-like isoform X1 n=1 Tax=Lupinus angustifolius TaxID=3871 RepID=UPI00092F3330|nr:PREDICTED: WAT1-related protein At5g64700-like isoform X1 [Lupinus angustifolius]